MDTRTVDLGAVQLAVAEAGVGGRPLLLLHGFNGAKEDFTEWLDRLAGAGWHVVAPDHRGHGASSKPEDEDAYSIEILAVDAVRLADALGWKTFVLLGHSMGGYVAQMIALACPGRLDGLVLMDTGHGPIPGIDPSQAEVAVQVARDQGMDVLCALMAAREGILDTPAHQRVAAERPDYTEFGERKFRATSASLYAAIAPELVGTFPDTLSRLAGLTPVPPTLVMVGEQDAPFLDFSRALAGTIAGATLAVIADAGHSPQFENPAGWWDALSTYLARVSEVSGLRSRAPIRRE